MIDKRLVVGGLLGGIGLGAAIVSGGLKDFAGGFLGVSPQSSHIVSGIGDFKAELALPRLSGPLNSEQLQELLQGSAYLTTAQYTEAAAIIGKYALMGDPNSQLTMGGMYAFGNGVPLDSKEALRWLRLAANQGDDRAKEFAAVIAANPDWEKRAAATTSDDALQSGSAVNSEYPQNEAGTPQYNPTNAARADTNTAPRSRYSGSPYPAGVGQSAVIGAQRSVSETYGSTSSSKGFLDAHSTAGEPNIDSRNSGIASPIILNRAGPKSYSDSSGDIYTQAGPKGVVNTRTGEFSPAN